MKTIKLKKYVTGTFVETYVAIVEVPDDFDIEDSDEEIIANLNSQELLDSVDWEQDQIHFDDEIHNLEYEISEISSDEEEK